MTTRARNVWITAAFAAIGLILAGRQAWQHRYDVYSDGLAYLDVGDALWRGDWANAITGYWSPLYASLTGGAIRLFRPSPEWEAPLVHAVNVACFAIAMIGFAFFLTELLALRKREAEPAGSGVPRALPDRAILVVAWILFSWAALELIGTSRVNPDMCVAAAFFFACALLVRQMRGPAKPVWFVGFGVVLGLAYLAKSVMFPLAFVFLAVSALVARRQGRSLRLVGLSLAAFLIVSAPFALALSRAKGRPTFGDSGKLAYAWFASVVPQPPIAWVGEPAGTGTPVHPRRRVFDVPAVYEFGSPVAGTYAYWQDPSYWLEGVKIRFDLRQQLRAVKLNAKDYAHVLLSVPAAHTPVIDRTILIGLVMLIAAGGWRSLAWQRWSPYALLFVPSVAMLAFYLMVHVEPRYIAAPAAVLFVTLFVVLSRGLDPAGYRVAICSVLLILGGWLIPAVYRATRASRSAPPPDQSDADDRSVRSETRLDKADSSGRRWQLAVASDLHRLGLRDGDRIGFIGFLSRFYWARLAGVRIVAEIRQPLPDELYWFAPEAQRYTPDVETFWAAAPAVQAAVFEAFAKTGARAVVTDDIPEGAGAEWVVLAGTGFGVRMLDRGGVAEVQAR